MAAPAEIVHPRSTRTRVGLGAAIVLVLIGLAIAILVSAFGDHGVTKAVTRPVSTATVAPGAATARASGGATIYVQILGAVTKPGLYLLSAGDRGIDAVGAAGGFTAAADQTQLNLARPLVDGEQIIVPVLGAAPVPAPGGGSVPLPGAKVNLNTADETALETLPEVGPATAKRILDWRAKNGRFSAIEDLMSVTGIGQKTFDQLKELVTV